MKKITLFIAIAILSSKAFAVSPQHDEYYSDDIFTAIEEAKHRTHHYNYSRHKRYNRTTSQSIDIPRLLNSEMDEQVIEGAVGATASGDNRINEVEEPVRQANLGQTISSEKLSVEQQSSKDNRAQKVIQSGTTTYIQSINYSGQEFTGSVNNIRADVSVSATARP
ncbi:hypothetical protein [Bacterioplanoides sp.]|uniref:hypothetical protein n=1 Tax=Bacterioplanoides sp. TaxID=2066072 RepID=UPI003B59711A